jgi:hypothetical protein
MPAALGRWVCPARCLDRVGLPARGDTNDIATRQFTDRLNPRRRGARHPHVRRMLAILDGHAFALHQ